MKLRVVSDGTAHGTYVVDEDSGQTLENVTSIAWEMEAGGQANCVIRIQKIAADIAGQIDRLID